VGQPFFFSSEAMRASRYTCIRGNDFFAPFAPLPGLIFPLVFPVMIEVS